MDLHPQNLVDQHPVKVKIKNKNRIRIHWFVKRFELKPPEGRCKSLKKQTYNGSKAGTLPQKIDSKNCMVMQNVMHVKITSNTKKWRHFQIDEQYKTKK